MKPHPYIKLTTASSARLGLALAINCYFAAKQPSYSGKCLIVIKHADKTHLP